MRIIAGEFKGRKLAGLTGSQIRPTSDRVREAVFNIIGTRIARASVADLFAGTGALGLEALSRRASKAVFVDISQDAVQTIKKNAAMMQLTQRITVLQYDLGTDRLPAGLTESAFDYVFMDPPYRSGLLERTLENPLLQSILKPSAVLVAEHASKEKGIVRTSGLDIIDQRAYGKTVISFMKKSERNIRSHG